MHYVEAWWNVLLPRVRPLLWENGGPVVMVQIENEYGAFASGSAGDERYKLTLLSLARSGLGANATIYTTDGDRLPEMQRGSFNDSRVFSAPDFGPGDPGFRGAAEMTQAAAALRAMNPAPGKAPLLCSEHLLRAKTQNQGVNCNWNLIDRLIARSRYYAGWATHWGQKAPAASSTADLVGNLSHWLLHGGHSSSSLAVADAGRTSPPVVASMNLYMIHGGSTSGWCKFRNSLPLRVNLVCWQSSSAMHSQPTNAILSQSMRGMHFNHP